jgi:aspartyl-tRNA(Asn)/glutamyl-tRNA(Gln) amidotransferase subunit C
MSTPLTRSDIAKVAMLARLKLSESELETLTTQLGSVLNYVEILNEVNTDDVEPMAHAVELSNVFRSDEIRDSLPRELALSNAPKTDGRAFLVPEILEGSQSS